MASINDTVLDYVKKNNMHSSSLDTEMIISTMMSEMKEGLEGKTSTYDMIPTYIAKNDKVETGREVIVLDAGGTNFRVCTVSIDGNRTPSISNHNTYPMPGIKEEINKEDFFETIYTYIKPVIDLSDKIGFCFSYPGEIDSNLDCTLLFFTKEIKAPEVIGEKIGENLNQVLEKHGHKRKEITILNDTIATLLAGMLNPTHSNFDNYIGFILGTGFNAGYMEKNSNIKKIADLDSTASQAINIEAGHFGKLPHSSIDEAFFKQTKDPDMFKFEKVISGAYLGGLCSTLFKQAASDGLFSPEDSKAIQEIEAFTTPEISHILEHGTLPEERADLNLSPEGMSILKQLSIHMTDRVAYLAAILLTAVALKEETGKSEDAPVCLSINGSTVEKMYGLKALLEGWLDKIMNKKYGIHYRILIIDNAPVIGSGIAALTRV